MMVDAGSPAGAFLLESVKPAIANVETVAGELAVLGEKRTTGDTRIRHINGAAFDIFYP